MRWQEKLRITAGLPAADAVRGNIREVSALKIRIRFKKYGVMKFIGHLDVMRYFQKCMRRAEIDIAYSAGFSPHQIMSFAAPLGVGATSDGEYLDIEVNTTRSSEQSVKALNEVMAEGMEITSYRRLKDTDKKAMSIVAAAEYKVWVKDGYEVLPVDYEVLAKKFFDGQESIEILKKTKKGEKTVDLKKLIYAFNVSMEEGRPVFYMKVSSGSTDNLKPELVLLAFYQFLDGAFDPLVFQIHRLDVYGVMDDRLVSLGDMGEEIFF